MPAGVDDHDVAGADLGGRILQVRGGPSNVDNDLIRNCDITQLGIGVWIKDNNWAASAIKGIFSRVTNQ